MQHLYSDANLWITEADRQAVRAVLLRSGYAEELAARIIDAGLPVDFARWESFVRADWSVWDISEYDHDLGTRYWIQVVIEHSCAETRARIEAEIRPVDDLFLRNMHPLRAPRISRVHLPLSGHPYFWETGSLHPDAAA